MLRANRGRLGKYIKIYKDGRDTQEAPGDIPLLGLGRQAFTNRYTFNGNHERYIYVVFSKYGALEYHILSGKVAYLPNVLRIRVNEQSDVCTIRTILHNLSRFKRIDDAFRKIPELDVITNVECKMSCREHSEIYHNSSRLWYDWPTRDRYGNGLRIPPFINFKTKRDEDDYVRMIIVTGNGIRLEIYNTPAVVVYTHGEKIVILSKYLIFYWGSVRTKDGYRLLRQYGIKCKSPIYLDILGDLFGAMQENPLRALPTPIQTAILEQMQPLWLTVEGIVYLE